MASSGIQNFTAIDNRTRSDEGEPSKELSPELIQVCHFLIYGIWVCLQGVNTFLWWHVTLIVLQMSRIILLKSISKIMLVCHLLIVSEGWSKLLGLPGVVAVTLTSGCKLCVDVSTMITGKDGFVLFCEITIITGNAVYLMGILLITHKRKANLWIIVGTITLSVFIVGCVENSVLLKCRNSEEKTRRLRIRSSAEFLYSMTCVVICSHRRSHLSHFYRVSYRYFWRRDS